MHSNSASTARSLRPSAFGSSVVWIGGPCSDRPGVESTLAGLGLQLRWATGVAQALGELREHPATLCLLDCTRGGEALRIARSIRTERPRAVLIGVVDPHRPETSLEAFRAGVFDILPWPLVPWELSAVISNAQDLLTLAHEANADTDHVEVSPYGIFGTSPAMRTVWPSYFPGSDNSVLIVVVFSLHARKARAITTKSSGFASVLMIRSSPCPDMRQRGHRPIDGRARAPRPPR